MHNFKFYVCTGDEISYRIIGVCDSIFAVSYGYEGATERCNKFNYIISGKETNRWAERTCYGCVFHQIISPNEGLFAHENECFRISPIFSSEEKYSQYIDVTSSSVGSGIYCDVYNGVGEYHVHIDIVASLRLLYVYIS